MAAIINNTAQRTAPIPVFFLTDFLPSNSQMPQTQTKQPCGSPSISFVPAQVRAFRRQRELSYGDFEQFTLNIRASL